MELKIPIILIISSVIFATMTHFLPEGILEMLFGALTFFAFSFSIATFFVYIVDRCSKK